MHSSPRKGGNRSAVSRLNKDGFAKLDRGDGSTPRQQPGSISETLSEETSLCLAALGLTSLLLASPL